MPPIEEPERTSDESPTRPALPVIRAARVLVVDDDELSREVLALKLQRDGHEVFQAASGDEVLGLLEALLVTGAPFDAVDLLVLDLHMPGRSGLDVLRRLRGRRCTIPALFVTGSPEPGLFTTAAVLDARVMLKPVPLAEFGQAALRMILGRAAVTPPGRVWSAQPGRARNRTIARGVHPVR